MFPKGKKKIEYSLNGGKKIAVYCDNYMKHINTLLRYDIVFVETDGAYRYDCNLKR
jgi:hypothetical protein